MNAINNQSLRYSNFLITFSTNVRPVDGTNEEQALVNWLVQVTDNMFGDWNVLNGTVIKPAGTPNADAIPFPPHHKIRSCRSRIAIEKGDFRLGKGQVHAHIVLEVAHEYTFQEHGATGTGFDFDRMGGGRANLGVHTNVQQMREYLNANIHHMALPAVRLPQKIYVNSKLLTKGTDNSNKWLTYQYLNKQTDVTHRNLREDENNANDPELSRVRARLRDGGLAGRTHEVRLDQAPPAFAPTMVQSTRGGAIMPGRSRQPRVPQRYGYN